MGQITTNAIVLRRADYRENDRMLTLFSPTLGRIDALCRGCRRQKSPLMAASELFCSGEYVLYQARERTTVISCQIADSYYPLRADYERLSHGVYALELCGAAVQPAQENERLFLLLLRALAYLSYDTVAPRRVTAVFLMGMMSLLGFRPQVGRCAQCGTPIALDGRADDDYAAYFGAQAGGVRMEAMFIDEGFGTLDPRSIQDALDVLSCIGSGGQVGIISHVDALRETIAQGIEVKKGEHGSRIVQVV